MRIIRKRSNILSQFLLIGFLSFLAVNNSVALGNFKESPEVTNATNFQRDTVGEPAAVAAALVVGVVSVMAAGVAFALGVVDGISGGNLQQVSYAPIMEYEQATYSSTDFSEFDN